MTTSAHRSASRLSDLAAELAVHGWTVRQPRTAAWPIVAPCIQVRSSRFDGAVFIVEVSDTQVTIWRGGGHQPEPLAHAAPGCDVPQLLRRHAESTRFGAERHAS